MTRPDPSCRWEQDLQGAGVDRFVLPLVFRIGMPVLAVSALVAAAVVAVVAPRDGEHTGWLGLALVALAAVPWLLWLAAGEDDSGPTATYAALALTPLAALGVGGRLSEPVALPSDLAGPLVGFPVLLCVLLFVGFATVRIAVATGIVAYLVLAVPVVVGWLLGGAAVGPDPAGTDVVTWHVGFALCGAAGYSVRLSYAANREVVQAREERARQEAADERRRIARDVHDVVAHSLAVTMLHVTAARMAVVRSSPDDAQEALVEAERHGRASLNDIRRIVGLLRSDDASAVDAAQPCLADVDALVTGFRAAGLTVETTLDLDDAPRTPAAELAVYRVLQEALANAARHGDGGAVVNLDSADGRLRVRVSNPVAGPVAAHRRARAGAGTGTPATGTAATGTPATGTAATGTPATGTAGTGTGSGLLGMRERVAAAGGTLEAGPRSGHWVVRAAVPTGAAVPGVASLPGAVAGNGAAAGPGAAAGRGAAAGPGAFGEAAGAVRT